MRSFQSPLTPDLIASLVYFSLLGGISLRRQLFRKGVVIADRLPINGGVQDLSCFRPSWKSGSVTRPNTVPDWTNARFSGT